ncbi:putative HC-toxin efflux carrier TOXA [Aspergillus udagawae]|nr:putative HC-toxin efflux carrier TOXA [Aspergillus udagawae]GFG14717.1 putative HC-toxin efflux carrier TOXA [Aspergillus udagawae]GFG25286.1 putative HC-toxin efflux carrier TOXA [Aspergillus udagawae]
MLSNVFSVQLVDQEPFSPLPFGGVVLLFVSFLLYVPGASSKDASTWKHKVAQLILEGVIALLPGVICLFLALEWGGFTYSWSNGRIIALLTVTSILWVAFILIQIWRPKTATVPPRIFIQRSILAGFWGSCTVGVHMTMFVYYFPIWFQSVTSDCAIESGIRLLPLVIAMVVSSIVSGVGMTKVGYYTPFLIAGTCMAPSVAAQTVLPRKEVAIGAPLMLFGQTLFGAIFDSVGQNVLGQHPATSLARIYGISISSGDIKNAGITGHSKIIPSHLGMEWSNVKEEAKKGESRNPTSENAAEDDKSFNAPPSDDEGGR